MGGADPAKRVVFISDIPTPYMAAVFRALAERTELTVLYNAQTGSRGADWSFDQDLGYRHEIVGGHQIERDVDSTDYYPDPRLLRAFGRTRPTAIVTGGFSFPTLYASLYGRLAGVPVVIHSDGTSDSEQGQSRAQGTARAVLLRRAGAAVGNSAAACARFAELGVRPERLLRANHTTDMERYWAVGRSRTVRADGPLTVISVGRLIPRKRLDRLIRAVAGARDRGADVRLMLVGSGPSEPELRSLVSTTGLSEYVDFHGFVDQPGLPALYAQADVFGFPTSDDPFGIVVLEAAAAGQPVLGSVHAGATPELVRDGRTGFAIEPEDIDAVAAHLVAMAEDREWTHSLGQAAHRETLERTPAAAAEAYLDAVRVAARPGAAIGGRRGP